MITIVFNNATRCGGACSYCSAAQQEHYTQGFDVNNIKRISDDAAKLIQFDFDALYNAIITNQSFKRDEPLSISLWGADPLNSFESFLEIYDFIEYLSDKENLPGFHIHGSTNGLAFTVPEWTEFLLKHKEHNRWQLSHDGLGQWIRTRDFNPLDIPEMKTLVNSGVVSSINCVLNNYNASPIQNIHYFRKYDDMNFRSIRIYNIREEAYQEDIKQINTIGMLNDKHYDELKKLPFGDLTIRNDVDLAIKTGLNEFAHQADLFFDEYDYIFSHIDKFPKKFINPLIDRIKRNAQRVDDYRKLKRPACAKYHMGELNWSPIIDTLGKYCECHLYDSNMHVLNPEMKKPIWCDNCKYKDRFECNICGSHPLPDRPCYFMYRFNQLMEKHLKLV